MTMRPRNHHNWTITYVIFRQGDGYAEGTHAWHPIFYVPGFEIGMPVEFLAPKTRLVIQATLMKIDIAIQQKINNALQAKIVHHIPKQGAKALYVEY